MAKFHETGLANGMVRKYNRYTMCIKWLGWFDIKQIFEIGRAACLIRLNSTE